jgi:uncharacterized membrane protein YeaQ/YmgE (transglycosylase-associated protein family)
VTRGGPCTLPHRLICSLRLACGSQTVSARSRGILKVPVLIVVFIFLGLIAGYIARGLFKSIGKSVALDLGLGVVGAVLVGSLFEHIAGTGTAGGNAATALVAALTGATALLATFHGLRDTRDRPRGSDLIGSSTFQERLRELARRCQWRGTTVEGGSLSSARRRSCPGRL